MIFKGGNKFLSSIGRLWTILEDSQFSEKKVSHEVKIHFKKACFRQNFSSCQMHCV